MWQGANQQHTYDREQKGSTQITAGGKPATHMWLGASRQHTSYERRPRMPMRMYTWYVCMLIIATTRKLKARKCPRSTPKRTQESPRRPQKAPGVPLNGTKRSPRGAKKRTQTARRKKNRTKTIPRSSWTPKGSISITLLLPRGRHLGGRNGTNTHPKSSKSKQKTQIEKTFQDDLGPVSERSGPFWGAILNENKPTTVEKRNVS